MVRIEVAALEKKVRGKRLALLMNNTAVTGEGRYLAEEIIGWGAEVVRLLAMEHGVWGTQQLRERVADHTDPLVGLPVASVYAGGSHRPRQGLLDDVDAVVFCAQDVGIRHWTYTTHMGYCMELAARTGTEVIVLDMPNPLGGEIIEGAPPHPAYYSLIGGYPYPLRHGMTICELALFINAAADIRCNLDVVPMTGWTRACWGDETGLLWTPPSPNLPTMDAVIGFAMMGLLQSTSLSVGLGTASPYQLFGAPWMDGRGVADSLNGMRLPGLRCLHKPFVPMYGAYAGEACSGVLLLCTDRAALRGVDIGLRILHLLRHRYGGQLAMEGGDSGDFDRRAGGAQLRQTLLGGGDIGPLMDQWRDGAEQFRRDRAPYLLYA